MFDIEPAEANLSAANTRHKRVITNLRLNAVKYTSASDIAVMVDFKGLAGQVLLVLVQDRNSDGRPSAHLRALLSSIERAWEA
jgi:hypothetical protein